MDTETEQPVTTTQSRPHTFTVLKLIVILCAVGFLALLITINYLIQPPSNLALPATLEVVEGDSVQLIAKNAQAKGIVRSDVALSSVLAFWYDPTNIHTGQYVFTEAPSVFTVAKKLADSDVTEKLVRITVPEGLRLTQIAALVKDILPTFDVDEYLIETHGLEGRLLPETYFVSEDFTATDFATLQRTTFAEKFVTLEAAIASSTLTEDEVITLASILEREANDKESMRTVAGILLNRLEIGMPLQADATIEYALTTPLNELRPGELAQIIKTLESPYNSYKNIGLPPTPIGNPGVTALEAALNPIPSEYLFYITDRDGNFHYAKTLREHNQNVNAYLK